MPGSDEISEIQRNYGIVGRATEIQMALTAVRSGKHLMIEGGVGVGKTVLAMAIANHLDRHVSRVDGDERYTEQKLAGWFDPPTVLQKGYGDQSFIPGPLTDAMRKGGVLFINEMNRMPEGVQNILLPAMDEGTIVLPHVRPVRAGDGFLVIATQNPREFVATTALSEALSDRFELLVLDYQSEEEETQIVRTKCPDAPEDTVRRAIWIARRTRSHPSIRRGASIRAALSIVELADAAPGDDETRIRMAARMAVPTRIEVREESNSDAQKIIDEIVDECFAAERADGDRAPPTRREEGGGPQQVAERKLGERSDSQRAVQQIETHLGPLSSSGGGDLGWAIAQNFSTLRLRIRDPFVLGTAKRIATMAMIRRVLQLLGPVSIPTRICREQFTPGEDSEIDFESTAENMIGKNNPEQSDIVVEKRRPKRMAVALMLDASLSMTGDKLAMATASIAVLAFRLKSVDYVLMTFNDTPKVLKRADEKKSTGDLVSGLLDFNAVGYTDIKGALRRGVEELRRARTEKRVGILVTDGNYTVGGDPSMIARAYDRLFVIMTDSHDCQPGVCDDIARNGRGRVYRVSGFEEMPRVLYRTLRTVSQGSPGM
jgi:MoxR-like ATPase/Mg-chelatase subunit ChlD